MDGILNLDDILSVEEIELDFVYDVAVEGNTNYYLANQEDKILVHNSSKTYSTCQYLIFYCLNNEGKIVTVARDNLVVNRRTVFADFLDILKMMKIHYVLNKSEMVIKLGTSFIRFVGLDDIHKIHGLKQDVCYVNEGLTIEEGKYLQLLQRTSEQLIIDYNPSVTKHFIYDWIDKREDVRFLKTTIFDNPLAPKQAIKQILGYEPTEENIKRGTANEYYWRVYGLGERFKGDEIVIRNYYKYTHDIMEDGVDWTYYGGDFGFTDPTTLVEVSAKGNKLYCRVHLYESGLTNLQIAQRIKNNRHINQDIIQVWDSAEPKSIVELRQNDIQAVKAIKGAHSIYFGIQKLQQYEIYVYDDFLGKKLMKELETMRWMTDSNGDLVKDSKGYPKLTGGEGLHICDPLRYIISKFNHSIIQEEEIPLEAFK